MVRALAIALVSVAAVGCRSTSGRSTSDAPAIADAPVAGPAELRFAIVGDTRPPSPDDTAHYPTEIITKIWQDVEAEVPHPQFAVSTGDYMFANTNGSQQDPQLAIYMTARAAFSGPQYPAMGNHECTGATASNCIPGADGVTRNLTAFTTTMLEPIGVTTPYYVEAFTAQDSSWTAKLVVVACNAWDSTQATWLAGALAEPTTYTFVVRHEGVAVLAQTPCKDSQPIIDQHPLTLLVVGHTHEYKHLVTDREVVVGNGGAPLTSGVNYGYVIVARDPAGTLTVTAHDYQTHAVLDQFQIQASGAPG